MTSTFGQRQHVGFATRVATNTVIGAAAAALISGAAAQEQQFCVVCAEPTAIYRCSIGGSTAASAKHAEVNSASGFACLKALSADGAHSTCSIKKSLRASDCDGPVRVISVDASAPVPSQSVAAKAPQAAAAHNHDTLAGVLAGAKEKTDANLKQIGAATKTAVQRTFSCVVSLFKNCPAGAEYSPSTTQ